MATIHKRRLRSGEMVWELTHGTGSDRQRFIAGRSREEAQATLNLFERQLALHGGAPQDGSIESVVGLFAEYLKVNRRENTASRYLRVVRTFVTCYLTEFHPEVSRLRQIRPQHVEEYKRLRAEGRLREIRAAADLEIEQRLRQQLASDPPGPAHTRGRYGILGRRALRARVSLRTVNYELSVLFTFFHWAVKRNQLFLNPAQTVERFRIPKRAMPKFMTTEDLKKFFTVCDDGDRRLFMAILLTGMRKGEVENLCWSDISFELGVIFIQEKPELNWKPKTDERLVPITAPLLGILREQYAHRLSDLLVFPNSRGNRDTDILERLKRLCRKAGIRLSTVHALRHSFGAHLRMAGASLADIGDLLGHKDLATTQIYAKVHQEHLRSVVSKLTPLAGDVSTTTPSGLPDVIVDATTPKGLLEE
jgi:integrase